MHQHRSWGSFRVVLDFYTAGVEMNFGCANAFKALKRILDLGHAGRAGQVLTSQQRFHFQYLLILNGYDQCKSTVPAIT